MMPSKITIAVIVGTFMLVGAVAIGATKGDQTPKARYGQTCVSFNDGGTHIATRVIQYGDGGSAQLAGANAFAVQNPSGATSTIYCGWDDTVNERTGFPLLQGATINVDITCPGGPGKNPDGGYGGAATDSCPTFYCVQPLNVGGAQFDDGGVACTRWIQVE